MTVLAFKRPQLTNCEAAIEGNDGLITILNIWWKHLYGGGVHAKQTQDVLYGVMLGLGAAGMFEEHNDLMFLLDVSTHIE